MATSRSSYCACSDPWPFVSWLSGCARRQRPGRAPAFTTSLFASSPRAHKDLKIMPHTPKEIRENGWLN
ncbi:hypothetical protein BS47DRAFT_1341764, partial [Hydnum rufescens UP504]